MNPNNIKKNDWILVKRDNGETHLGRASKVVTWKPNPKVTAVSWINVEETYKFTADARNCSLAPAHLIPKEPAVAPVDPIMAQWSLGKTKRGPMMMEGYYFAVPVLHKGKKIGEIIDEGNGGSVMTRFTNHAEGILFGEACRKWAMQNLADGRYADEYEHFWGWWDEARPKGIDAKTYFKNEKEKMLKYMGT